MKTPSDTSSDSLIEAAKDERGGFMDPAPMLLAALPSLLTNTFREKELSQPDRAVRLTGILFARPTSPLAKAEITPNLDDLHHRSGKHIQFLCAGYRVGGDSQPGDQAEVNSNWVFSAERFNAFRAEMEEVTTWRYSGGVDLILINARYDAED